MKKKRMTPAAFEHANVTMRDDKKTTSEGIAGSRREIRDSDARSDTPPRGLSTSGSGRLSGVASGVASLLGLPASSPQYQSPHAVSPRSPAYHTPPASPRPASGQNNTSHPAESTTESNATSASQSHGTPGLPVPLPQPATDSRGSTTSATNSEPNQDQGQPARAPAMLRRLLPFNLAGSKEEGQQQRRRRE